MKTTILPNNFIRIALLFASAELVTAGTRDDRGLAGVGNALPATIIVVTNTNDSGPGSLRNALAIANDGDTIDAIGVSGTILLTSGELQIDHNVTINGPGAANLAINGNGTFRVFENFNSNVTISGLTITNGRPPGPPSATSGGGILNHGGLILSDSIVSNSGAGNGGGISCDGGGTLTVMSSTFTDNSALFLPFGGGTGGGISVDDGTVAVNNSTISNNSGVCSGGGIAAFNNAQLTVMNSTISGNSSVGWSGFCDFGLGGGIYFNGGTLTVMNSTISANITNFGRGGGICLFGGTLTVMNSTINGTAGAGGGIDNEGTMTIGDSVLDAGLGYTITNEGTATSLGYNLASDNGSGVLTGPGDQINTDPMLGPLQDNGGPTFTHALLPGSPAIDAGDPSFAPPPFYDQRGPGYPRVVNSRIDKGSFEVQSGGAPTPTPTLTPAPTPTVTPSPKINPTPRPRPTPAPRL
jgi:hypothetical protein